MTTARWVVAHGAEERARLDEFFPGAQVHVVMSPAEYLAHCAAVYRRRAGGRSVDPRARVLEATVAAIAEWPRAGRLLDAACLEVDPVGGTVLAQEGRHRAIAAERLGLTRMPMILYARLPRYGTLSLDDELRGGLRSRFGWAPWTEAEPVGGPDRRSDAGPRG